MAVRRRVEEEWEDDGLPQSDVERSVVDERTGPSPAMRLRNLFMSLVGAALAVVLVLLGARLLMLLFDANANNTFVQLVDDLSSPLVAPFDGIAADRRAGDGILEVSTVVAMVAYLIAGLLAILVLGAAFSWSDGEERSTSERRVRK